jgi:Flp pilus assembly protein TadD
MAEARLLQGIAQVLAERPGLAIAPLESVVKEAPRSSSAHWWLAKALLMTQRRDEAMPHLREVVSLGNDYATEASKVLAAAEPAGA